MKLQHLLAPQSQALPIFHAYTGCDTVSSFNTKGKKTAWETWKTYEDVTSTFLVLSKVPSQISDDGFAVLERFTISLYDCTSTLVNIDQAWQEMFARKGGARDAIPPTRAALLQHIKRTVYQGGHCWGNACKVKIALPSPEIWGWTDPPNWKPLWTTQPEANKSARELIRCGCKLGCKGGSSCKKAALKCTGLCQPCRRTNCEVKGISISLFAFYMGIDRSHSSKGIIFCKVYCTLCNPLCMQTKISIFKIISQNTVLFSC